LPFAELQQGKAHETGPLFECVRHIPFLLGLRGEELERVLKSESEFLSFLERKLPKQFSLLRGFVVQEPKDRPKLEDYKKVHRVLPPLVDVHATLTHVRTKIAAELLDDQGAKDPYAVYALSTLKEALQFPLQLPPSRPPKAWSFFTWIRDKFVGAGLEEHIQRLLNTNEPIHLQADPDWIYMSTIVSEELWHPDYGESLTARFDEYVRYLPSFCSLALFIFVVLIQHVTACIKRNRRVQVNSDQGCGSMHYGSAGAISARTLRAHCTAVQRLSGQCQRQASQRNPAARRRHPEIWRA
jgi:hypothetical protein